MVRDAIGAGIFNDLGSGSNIDLCVITKDGAQYLRTYEEANKKGERSVPIVRRVPNNDLIDFLFCCHRQGKYQFKRGTTDVLTTKVIPLEIEETTIRPIEEQPMEIA